MRTLIPTLIIYYATYISAAPGGIHGGTVLSGPSGIVTSHGAIGPAALGLGGLGYGDYAGYGSSGAYLAGPAGPSAYVAGPALSHASVIGPAAGLGLEGFGGLSGYGGYGGFGGYRGSSDLGLAHGVAVTNGGGTIRLGPHGVTVKGPPTVTATIAGPAGKVVADGLYGLPSHGHGW